jgi:hypothetical protein
MNRRDLFTGGGAAALLLNSAGAAAAMPASTGFLSAADFGATGDGVTDDTGALQTALDAALNRREPTFLHIPPGRYRVSRTLRVDYGPQTTGNVVHPHGILAHGAALVSAIADGSDILRFTSHATARFLLIEGLSIRGNRGEGNGLTVDCNREGAYLYNICLRDIVIENCGGNGLQMAGNVFEGQIFNTYLRDNRRSGAIMGHGDAGGVLSAIHVFGSVFGGNGDHGAVLANTANDVSFHGCYFLENGRFGLAAANGCPLLSHCGFENNHMSAGSREAGDAGANLPNFGTLIGCTSHSIHYQTHLVKSFVIGNLTMIGCMASGSRLATLTSDGRGRAALIGCRGAVDRGGDFLSFDTGGAGAAFGERWDSSNLVQIGAYRLWVDGAGKLRMKKGMPASEADGAPVGL